MCESVRGKCKTGLEQSPVTDSRKAYGPHKSTVTTHRKSVQSVKSVKSVVEKRNLSVVEKNLSVVDITHIRHRIFPV